MNSLFDVWRRSPPIAFPSLRLTGQRIVLRPPDLADWPSWMNLRDRDCNHLIPFEPAWSPDSLSRDAFTRKLTAQSRDWQLGLSCSFLIFRNDPHQIMGGINLNNIVRGSGQYCSLGYWLGEEFQGQGYMSEAMRLALTYGFETLQLHRINAATLPHNGRSIRLLRRFGFEDEGFAREYLQINGEWQDHMLFGLTEDSFRKRVVVKA